VSKRNRSHTQTHDQNNTTNDPVKDHPPSLNNNRRWRGDGAYHLPRPGGWPRRSKWVNPKRAGRGAVVWAVAIQKGALHEVMVLRFDTDDLTNNRR